MKTKTLPEFGEMFSDISNTGQLFFISKDLYRAENEKGEFQFNVCIQVLDWKHYTGENGFYVQSIAVVRPEYLSTEKIESIARMTDLGINEIGVFDVQDYGLSARFEESHFETFELAIEQVEKYKDQSPLYGSLCGFYFDRPANRAGNTGWDFLMGQL